MAEKIFNNVRLGLKVDTLENWNSSTLPLKKGEVAFATTAASAGNGLTEPVVMMKIGEDGVKTFKDIEWNFYAKASDVLAACKSTEALTAFVNSVIADAGIATDEALETLAGKVTTAEGKITTLEGEMDAVEKKAADNETAIGTLNSLVGSENVATQIQTAINALKLSETYEVKGEAAKVQTALDTYKTSNDKAVADNKAAIEAEAATARAAEKANADAITAIKDGTTIDSFADVETALNGKEAAGAAATAEANAKAYADGLAGNYDAKGAAATAEQNAKDYADGLAGNYDEAGAAATAEQNAKDYTDAEIAEWVGEKTVAGQIADAIAPYSTTEQMNTAIATAKGEATKYADGLNTAMNTRVEALEAIDHDHANKAELDKIAEGDVVKWNAAEQNAKDYADTKDEAITAAKNAADAAQDAADAAQGEVDALETYVGVIPETAEAENIVAYIQEKTAGIATDTALEELTGRVAIAEGKITTLEGVVGDAEDGLVKDVAGLKTLVGETAVADQISTAVEAEKARAEGIEAGLRTDVDAIKGDYLKAADKTDLQNQINLIMNNPDTENVINSISEFTQYIEDHGEIAEGFRTDIDANKAAIEAEVERAEGVEADLQKAIEDEAARATGIEGGLDTRLKAVEAAVGESGSVAGDIADALTEAKGYTDTEVQELAGGAVATNAAAIEALEGLVGEKSVATQISEAIAAENLDQYATDTELAGAVERIADLEKDTHTHANKAELDLIATGDKAKWDAKVDDVTAAADSGLKATRTGNTVAIEIDESLVWVLDCGDSTTV